MNTLISKAKQLVLEMDDFLGIADDDLSISEDSVISTREEPTQTAPSSPEPQTQILTNLIETSKFHSVHLFALNPLKYSIQVRLASTHAVSSNPIVISTSISKIPPLAIIEVYNDSGLLGICKLPVPSCSKCSIVDLLTSKTVGELIVGVSINDNDIENLKQKVTLLSGLLEAKPVPKSTATLVLTIHKATNLKSLPSTSFKHSRKSVFITTIQIVPGYEDACISLSGSGYNIQSSIEQTLICDGCDSEFWRYFTKGDGYGQIFCDGNLVGNFVIPLSPILNSVDGYNRKWFIVEDMDGEPKAAVNFSARFTSGVEFGVKPLISTSWAVRADIKIQESESGYLFLVNKTEIGNEMILDKGDFEISVVDGEGYLVGKLFFNGNSAYEHVMRGIRRRRVITETIVETCWVISEGDEFYGESFQVTVNFESYDSKSVSKVQKQLEIPVIEEIIEQPIEKVVEIQVESPKREISQQTEIQVPQTTFIITIHETTVNATTAKFNWPPSNGTLYTVSLITPSPSIFKIPTSSIKELLNTDLTVEFLKNDNRIGISRIELAMNVLEEINGWYKIVNDGIEVGTCLVEIKYDCKCIEAEIARVLFSVEEWKEAVNYDKSFQEEFVAQVLEFQESPDIVEPSNIINTSPDKSVHFDTLKSLAESMIEICINASTDDRNIESEFHEEYTLTPVLNILDHYWLSSPKMSPKVKHDALKPDTPVSSPRSKIVSPKHETPLSSPRSKIISPQNTHLYYSPKLALNSYNIESRNIKTQQYFADVNEEFVYRKNEIGLKDVKMLGKEFKQEKVEPVLEKKDAVFGKSEIERLLAIYSK